MTAVATADQGPSAEPLSTLIHNLARQEARRTGRAMFGRVIVAEMSRRHDDNGQRFPTRNIVRVREIERIIRARHGWIVPDPHGTDDRESCVAYLFAAAGGNLGNARGWAARWTPWIDETTLAKAEQLERKLAQSKGGREAMLPADAVADLLRVSFEERTALGLTTIGACDVSEAERKAIAKNRKRQRDRERQADKRRRSGSRSWAEHAANSASKTRPWDAEGISRRTYYYRLAQTHREQNIEVAGEAFVQGEQIVPVDRPPSIDHSCPMTRPKAGSPGSRDESLAEVREAAPPGANERRSAHG